MKNINCKYLSDVITYQDYYPFGMQMPGRSFSSENYRYGFNGHEKVDEISGQGNHTTATFWEYDTRIGRRWNQDPKPNPSISNYASFANNPIMFSDALGDTIRTNTEGAQNTNMAIEGLLDGKTNPIGFDSDKGILTYHNNVDISWYSDVQKDVLGRYQELITNKSEVNLKVVDINDAIEDAGGKSLKDLNAAGITVPYKYQDGSIAYQNVYVGRNPVKSNGSPEKKEYSGITNIHELGGHSFLNLTQPALKKNDHNKLVEDLHKKIFMNYKVNGAIWYKRSSVPPHDREEE